MCLYTMSPDEHFIVDRHPANERIVFAAGLSGHGFGLGPGAGQLMAEIITGEKPCVDPTPFRHGRFGWFSRPAPTTGL